MLCTPLETVQRNKFYVQERCRRTGWHLLAEFVVLCPSQFRCLQPPVNHPSFTRVPEIPFAPKRHLLEACSSFLFLGGQLPRMGSPEIAERAPVTADWCAEE